MQNEQVISLGYFFDGTGNNGINIENNNAAPKNNNNSYFQNKTNVFKLFSLCTFEDNNKCYIEGVGTKTGKEDSNWAMATCMNPAGYEGYSSDDKLAIGINHFNSFLNNNKDKNIEVYVYGFSRGSTLARAFVNEILANQNVKIKFLGLFDTVESTNIINPAKLYPVFFTEQTLSKIDEIIHLCAMHECRYYFPLTRVLDIPKNLKDSFSNTIKEIFVPGAHADVGGGYVVENESLFLNEFPKSLSNQKNDVEKIKTTVQDSFGNYIWTDLLDENKNIEYPKSSILMRNIASQRPSSENNYPYQVSDNLSNVYGQIMAIQTNKTASIFTLDNTLDIDKNLEPLKEYLLNYITNKTPKQPYNYNALYNYIHISTNFGIYKKANQKNISLNSFDFNVLKTENNNYEAATAITLMPYPNGANNTKWERKIITKR